MKVFLKKYGSVILALVLIAVALKYNSTLQKQDTQVKEDTLLKAVEESNQAGDRLSPEESVNGQPQFPVLFSSKGQITADVIYNSGSLYGNVAVYDYKNVRSLLIDGTLACTYNFRQDKATAHVHEMVEVVKNYAPADGDTLLIGMGCGGFLKELSNTDYNLDVVEINPKVVNAAERFFNMPDSLNYKTTIDDGLHFLKNTDKKYDAIVVDLCEINEYNSHLYTKEFYKLAKSKLKNKNSFLVQSLNIYRAGDPERLDHKMANTMREVFQKVFHSDRTVGEAEYDVLDLVAADREFSSTENVKLSEWELKPSYGIITQENSLQMAIYNIPASNELRKQSRENYGFDIQLKQ